VVCWCARGWEKGATFGLERMRDRTVSLFEIVRLSGSSRPVVLDWVIRLPRLRVRLMLSRSSRFVGRCPSWCSSFSSSAMSEDVSELDELELLLRGRGFLPSSSSTWVSDEGRSGNCAAGLADVASGKLVISGGRRDYAPPVSVNFRLNQLPSLVSLSKLNMLVVSVRIVMRAQIDIESPGK
jgi:hypothetical protein